MFYSDTVARQEQRDHLAVACRPGNESEPKRCCGRNWMGTLPLETWRLRARYRRATLRAAFGVASAPRSINISFVFVLRKLRLCWREQGRSFRKLHLFRDSVIKPR